MNRLYPSKTIAVQRRSTSGQHLVELMSGLIIAVPIFLLMVDLIVLYMAQTVNDTACRDATRAASTIAPADSDANGALTAASPIFLRAQAVCRQLNTGGGYIVGPTVVSCTLAQLTRPTGTLGGIFGGYVTVRTHVDARLPAPVPFVGLPAIIPIDTNKTFPLTATQANTTVIN